MKYPAHRFPGDKSHLQVCASLALCVSGCFSTRQPAAIQCSDSMDCPPEQYLSPALFLFPGRHADACEAATIRNSLVSACSTAAVDVMLYVSSQYIMELTPIVHASSMYSNGYISDDQMEDRTCKIDSMHVISEPWMTSCIFVTYSVYNANATLLKHARVVLVLTPPHLETAPTGTVKEGLPWAIGSCNSCLAPIRRLGELLGAWNWPAITISGRSWRALVDISQQKAQFAALRDGVHSILLDLV